MSSSDTDVYPGVARRLVWSLGDRVAYPGLVSGVRRANEATADGAEEIPISYGPADDQRALLFVPHAPEAAERPAVLFVHGGSWTTGAPEHYRFVGRYFASAGYAAAVVGYRHAPEFRFPAQRDDTASGVRASIEGLRREGVAAEATVLAGHSAGAHLAALVAFDPEARSAAFDGGDSEPIGGAFLSGPLDLQLLCPRPRLCPVVRRLMGSDTGWDAADPVLFVRPGKTVPVLAIHGARDPVVALASPASFVARVRDAGEAARLLVAPGAYHANLVGIFLGSQPGGGELLEWIEGLSRARGHGSQQERTPSGPQDAAPGVGSSVSEGMESA